MKQFDLLSPAESSLRFTKSNFSSLDGVTVLNAEPVGGGGADADEAVGIILKIPCASLMY